MNLKQLTSNRLIILVSVFIMLTGNFAFFDNVERVYPFSSQTGFYYISLFVVFTSFTIVLLSILSFRKSTRPLLVLILMLSAGAAYFMDTYNIVIDDSMIDNIFKTDAAEAGDLFSFRLLVYLLLLGVLPSVFVYRVSLKQQTIRQELLSRLMLFTGALIVAFGLILISNNFYASFFREHKPLRFYSNPGYYVYSSVRYASHFFAGKDNSLITLGEDAMVPSEDKHRELIIMVLGETARADRFQLNGYDKPTNPLLSQENVISFQNVWACGTSTATSVPCMFSIHPSDEFSKAKASHVENVLDILQRAGVNVLWLDNNSDSKGVALRVPHEDYKSPAHNPVCDVECRDEGMLQNLQAYIDQHKQGDIFIVLHQMGNHGPAYYKRYPERFEVFNPVCKTNQLESCSNEEINNAYDNAIVYTDYLLSKTIELLKQNSDDFEAGMLYVSDHGESLGEHGLYLHGLPNLFAPDEQRRVPMIMWFSDSFDFVDMDYQKLRQKREEKFSHDNLFHTILGLLEVRTSVYDPSLDIIDHPEEHH